MTPIATKYVNKQPNMMDLFQRGLPSFIFIQDPNWRMNTKFKLIPMEFLIVLSCDNYTKFDTTMFIIISDYNEHN